MENNAIQFRSGFLAVVLVSFCVPNLAWSNPGFDCNEDEVWPCSWVTLESPVECKDSECQTGPLGLIHYCPGSTTEQEILNNSVSVLVEGEFGSGRESFTTGTTPVPCVRERGCSAVCNPS